VALFLIMSTFYVSSPLVPRIMAIIVAAIGVAVIAGLIPVRGPQDFYGGLALVMLATFALVASAELPGQRGFAFGPGTAPRLFAGILAAIGFAVALTGVLMDGPRIEKYKIYGPAMVLIGISLFATLIRPFGLITATYLAFLVSIMGSREMKWIESLIAAAAMTLGCVLLFVYLLNLPFQLWPPSNAFTLLFNQSADIFKTVIFLVRKIIPGL
jgi:putative tricarboxylic transport membrane protein